MITSRKKCRCLCNHSPTSIEAGDTRIILAVTCFDICGWMIVKATAVLGVPIIYSVKCDVRHRLHCSILTDTNLYKFTKGKTNLVNQRWRHTTCLQHPCYDVGCYPCFYDTLHYSSCVMEKFYCSWQAIVILSYLNTYYESHSKTVYHCHVIWHMLKNQHYKYTLFQKAWCFSALS